MESPKSYPESAARGGPESKGAGKASSRNGERNNNDDIIHSLISITGDEGADPCFLSKLVSVEAETLQKSSENPRSVGNTQNEYTSKPCPGPVKHSFLTMTKHTPVQPANSNALNRYLSTNLGLVANATKLATVKQSQELSGRKQRVTTPMSQGKNMVISEEQSKMVDTLSQRTRGILGNETPEALTNGDI